MTTPSQAHPDASRAAPITIDVFADVVCPWCYIGLRRLEHALAKHASTPVARRWRPFQLRPDMPAAGQPWRDFMEEKFGGEDHAAAAFRHVTELGRSDGLDFRFDRIANAPNTTDAHRLILLAHGRGLAWDVAEALFRAYFTGGRNLDDRADLLDVATGAGLDAVAVAELLAGDEHAAEVAESQRHAQRLGVTGVPFYVLEGRHAISGAQPVESFTQVLERIGAERAEGLNMEETSVAGLYPAYGAARLDPIEALRHE